MILLFFLNILERAIVSLLMSIA